MNSWFYLYCMLLPVPFSILIGGDTSIGVISYLYVCHKTCHYKIVTTGVYYFSLFMATTSMVVCYVTVGN